MKNNTIKIFFITVFLLITGINAYETFRQLSKTVHTRLKLPYTFFGDNYKGLGEALKNVDIIGYYTDADIEEPLPRMRFLQTQYALAPVILDHKSLNYKLILLECSSIESTMEQLKKLNAKPLKSNNRGGVLAIRP